MFYLRHRNTMLVLVLMPILSPVHRLVTESSSALVGHRRRCDEGRGATAKVNLRMKQVSGDLASPTAKQTQLAEWHFLNLPANWLGHRSHRPKASSGGYGATSSQPNMMPIDVKRSQASVCLYENSETESGFTPWKGKRMKKGNRPTGWGSHQNTHPIKLTRSSVSENQVQRTNPASSSLIRGRSCPKLMGRNM